MKFLDIRITISTSQQSVYLHLRNHLQTLPQALKSPISAIHKVPDENF